MKIAKTLILMLILLSSIPCTAQIDQELAQVSLYELSITGKNQDGVDIKLQNKKGKNVLLGFFYASCNYTCPMLLEALKKMDQQLSVKALASSQIILISLDPKNDTPAVLKSKMTMSHLDPNRYTFVNIGDKSLREISTILDVKYRPSGPDINHSTVISILDPFGKIIFREEGLGDTLKQAADLLNKNAN